MRWKIIDHPRTQNISCSSYKILFCVKIISNKQSAKVFFGLIDKQYHTAMQETEKPNEH